MGSKIGGLFLESDTLTKGNHPTDLRTKLGHISRKEKE